MNLDTRVWRIIVKNEQNRDDTNFSDRRCAHTHSGETQLEWFVVFNVTHEVVVSDLLADCLRVESEVKHQLHAGGQVALGGGDGEIRCEFGRIPLEAENTKLPLASFKRRQN